MNTHRCKLLAAVLVAAAPWLFALAAEPEKKPREFAGKVVPLGDALGKHDVKLDRDAEPFWLALTTDDGQVYPLIKDPGTRMFFKDKKLQKRPMKLTGRLIGDTKMLQVLTVRSVVDGKLHEPYYWCDICKIKRFEPNACDCCGAALEFREEPVAR